jgi:hypothetical protein
MSLLHWLPDGVGEVMDTLLAGPGSDHGRAGVKGSRGDVACGQDGEE